MSKTMKKEITYKNKRAYFDFNILSKMEAGIMLKGSEIKSLRNNKANINGSYCVFNEKYEVRSYFLWV